MPNTEIDIQLHTESWTVEVLPDRVQDDDGTIILSVRVPAGSNVLMEPATTVLTMCAFGNLPK